MSGGGAAGAAGAAAVGCVTEAELLEDPRKEPASDAMEARLLRAVRATESVRMTTTGGSLMNVGRYNRLAEWTVSVTA